MKGDDALGNIVHFWILKQTPIYDVPKLFFIVSKLDFSETY